MMVFGSGAVGGLLSSLLAYVGRTVMVETSGHLVMRDLLRVGAIVAAVGSGAAFLTGLNMMALTAPESSSRPKSNRPDQPGSESRAADFVAIRAPASADGALASAFRARRCASKHEAAISS